MAEDSLLSRAAGFAVLVLGTVACAEADPAPSTRATHVWSGAEPDFSTGDISPDGRHFSDTDWDTGDLQIVDLETGEARLVTGKGYGAGRYAWTSSFSTDGRRVAVSWYLYGAGGHELRVMNVDGTASRVLLAADEDVTWVDPLDWSPSDETLLVALGRTEGWQLGLVSLHDGSVRTLKTLSWLAPGGEQSYPRASFSPDGRYIAYDYRPDLEERDRSVFALPVDGGGETELVSGPGVNRFLGWFPDGRAILFHGERSGTSGIWRLPVRDGSPAGEPELVHPEMPALSPLGFTSAGFAYGAPDEAVRVHTATVDLESGRVLEPPQAVATDSPSRLSLAPDWSPDGDHLAYVAHAPQPNAVETLVVRTVSGEVVETVPLSPAVHTSSATFRWIRDDTIVLFGMVRGRNSILRMDPRDGSFRRLPERVTEAGGNLKWFGTGPEGRTLYLVLPPEGENGSRAIVARDARTGEERVITTARTDHRTLAVSPGGDRLAYIARGDSRRLELRTTATSGAPATRTLYRAAPGQTLSAPVAWTPDGSRVLFVSAPPDGDRALSSVAADGHEEPIRLEDSAWCCGSPTLRVHPDGRRITMVAGRDRGSIWLLEGLRSP